MIWNEKVDRELQRLSSMYKLPDGIALARPIHSALRNLENESTTDPRTLRAAQVLAEAAIHPMVTGIAATVDDGLVSRLRDMDKWWSDRGVLNNSHIYSSLSRVSMYYTPPAELDSRGEPLDPRIYPALSCAGLLLESAYPVSVGTPIDDHAKPQISNTPELASFFAVTSQVHREMCGPEPNDAAIATVALALEATRQP